MDIKLKSKFPMGENFPFPCSEFTIQVFDNFDYRIKCKISFLIFNIVSKVFEMLTIDIYPLLPTENKNCTK